MNSDSKCNDSDIVQLVNIILSHPTFGVAIKPTSPIFTFAGN